MNIELTVHSAGARWPQTPPETNSSLASVSVRCVSNTFAITTVEDLCLCCALQLASLAGKKNTFKARNSDRCRRQEI